MQVTCSANTARALPREFSRRGYFEESVFHIVVGKAYFVFGISLWDSRMILLISDETNLPSWYPAELFTVNDPLLPSDWFCDINLQSEGGLKAIWGYDRLVRDGAHHDALQRRDRDALEIFREEQRKRTAQA